MKVKTLDDIPSVASYLKRVGAEARSLRSAVAREKVGNYYRDVCVIRFAKDGLVRVTNDDYAPKPSEQDAIEKDFKEFEFPKLKKLPNAINLPPAIKEADKEDLFVFRNVEGEIIMIQKKGVNKKGEKYFIPYTYWDDDTWEAS